MVTGYIICLIVGGILGMSITFIYAILKKRTIGKLIIGRSGENDDPNLFLDLTSDIETIEKLEFATCKVVKVRPSTKPQKSQK